METVNNIKVCQTCGMEGKHQLRTNKEGKVVIFGKKCIKCKSQQNNQRLRDKNYYKTYYANNIETFKARDKARYAKIKAEKNLVKFNFPNVDILDQPETNI
jgi:hypothetical protein